MDDRLVRPKSESLAERSWRSLLERLSAIGYGTPLYSVRLKGRYPLKLLASPDDPWPGDPESGASIAADRFSKAGHRVTAKPEDLWEKAAGAPASFTVWLQGFGWLRDLAAAREAERGEAAGGTGRLAEAIVGAWLARYEGWHAVAWRPDILGERLMMWILHAPLILSSSDMVYRSAVLNSLVRQSRHLGRAISFAGPGPRRVTAAVGLILSGLLVAGGERRAKRGFVVLRRTLEALVLADGGPVTRNPADAVRMVRDLVVLKRACAVISATLPDWVQQTLDRLVPFIRALCHKDHRLAHFNGAFAGDCPDVEELSDKADAHGKAIASASHTGYQRLKRWRTLVIADAGAPPARGLHTRHHAGTGSIEFSDGPDRIVVNVGGSDPGYGDDPEALMELSRTTAAHSALVIENTNSAQLRPGGHIGHIGQSPLAVDAERTGGAGGQWVDISHDGYARWGITVKRRLFLAASGDDLRGEDRVLARPSGIKRALTGDWPKAADIRFHLHPRISASLTQDGRAMILRLPHGHGWLFRWRGAAATLERSIYMEQPGALVMTRQIVLSGSVAEGETIFNWSFKRMDSGN